MVPLACLLTFGLALLFLAWRWQVYPHRPLIVILCVPAVLSIWLIPLPALWPWLVAVDIAMALLAGIDAISLARSHSFHVERHVGTIASLRKPHAVALTIVNSAARAQPVWIRDGVPNDLSAEPDEFCVQLPQRSRSTLRYTLRAERRGAFTISNVFLRVRSRWGFWQRTLRLRCRSRLNVYPDMKQLEEYALLARTNRLSLMGVRRTRKVGEDNEFERLRDFTRDDNYRHINWRATARKQKLIVKDFQANQSQRLVFLVDCGRMMTGEAAGVSLLDHALNAMLMLSFVALRQGDQVGLLCFSDRIHTFVPPRGGRGQMNRILHAAYDRFPEMVESRYEDAFLHLGSRVRKRALVVLITNVIDEVNAHQISGHLRALAGRHLPLGVFLRDHSLFDAVDKVDLEAILLAEQEEPAAGQQSPGESATAPAARKAALAYQANDPHLFTAAAAAEILTWRMRVLIDLEMSGALSLDVFPEELVAPLVNRYLDIKARHLL
jgi:uncharacterized protein (DUF58 family)